MFEFKYEYEGREVIVRLRNPHLTHPELAELFNYFLRGIGYEFDGEYSLVEEDT